MTARSVSLDIHGALEVTLAPAIMAAPFVLGFGELATAIAVVIGAVLLGSALSLVGERRTVSLSAHAGFDYALAYVALIGGVVAGLLGDVPGMTFLVGVGAAQALLTATTRFSLAPRGA
ncbi:MAG TPA: hypothetical protein VFY99_07440 [Solirubrobacterales bacterium]